MGKLTYENWADETVGEISRGKDYFEIIKWAYQEFDKELVYACSFGAEGIVLLDLITKVKRDARIVFLDTGLHFTETYQLIEEIKERFPELIIEKKQPTLTVAEQASIHGDSLWKTKPNFCCQMRKIEPLQEALSGAKAWISGLRREQSITRRNVNYLNKDEKFKLIKICPLIHWTWEDVWTYIRLNNLPYNKLHDQKYPSIGCAPCTRQVLVGDQRSGRWADNDKTECGIHVN